MNKHTPGPWRVADQGWTTDIMAHPCGVGRLVMETFDAAGSAMRPTKAERKANARLIAAAPDLLAALEHMLGACDPTVDRDDDEHFDYADAYIACDAARAAIAKARGES